ncbi:MAG: hypothetical protein ACXV5D_09095 [Halobacteriota archaeon]
MDLTGFEHGAQDFLVKRSESGRQRRLTKGVQHELERAQDRIKVLEERVTDLQGQVLTQTAEEQRYTSSSSL